MKISTLIVDDEPLAREWVRNGLQDDGACTWVRVTAGLSPAG